MKIFTVSLLVVGTACLINMVLEAVGVSFPVILVVCFGVGGLMGRYS